MYTYIPCVYCYALQIYVLYMGMYVCMPNCSGVGVGSAAVLQPDKTGHCRKVMEEGAALSSRHQT